MNEPKMIKKIGLVDTNSPDRVIAFNTDEETAEKLRKFGSISKPTDWTIYSMVIDARYDYREVRAYIESLNEGFE